MSGTIDSRLFYNRFTATPGGGVPYVNMPVTSRVNTVIEVSFGWDMTDVRIRFNTTDDSITMLNDSDGRTFTEQGFQDGDTITVTDAGANNGDYTIDTISDDGRTLYVVENLTTATDNSCNIYGVTPITAIDLYYNLIENSEAVTYYSKTDANTEQRFTATGLDATDTLHEVNFQVRTKSRGWVTNVIDVDETGETSEVTIIGAGVTNYRQYFTITQRFYVAPLATVDQYQNFTDELPPDYYTGAQSLKHIVRVDARFDEYTPEADHTAELTDVPGIGGWHDQGIKGTRPEYYCGAVEYQIGGATATTLDVNQAVNVTIPFYSRNGKFVNGGTRCILNFHLFPDDPNDYTDTDTTLVENFNWDIATAVVGGASVDGSLFGTSRQAIRDCTFTFVSANEVTVEFTFQAGADLVTYWEGKADGSRQFVISLASEDDAVTTTKASDCNSALATFDTAAWDKTDTTLFDFTGSGIYCYSYPDQGVFGVGNIDGFEGDPWLVKVPFLINNVADADGNTPTVKQVKVQILATKTGNDDFVLEEKAIDCNNFRKVDDIQLLEVDESRGFISYDDDPYNAVILTRDAGNDTATQAAYELSYGLVLRYEQWLSAYDSQRLSEDGVNEVPDVAKQITNITHRWANYSGVNGWALKLRLTVVVTGTDGFDNEFYSDANVTVRSADQIVWAGIGGGATQSLQYFTEDESEELFCLVRDGVTLVRCTWTGDFPEPADASGYCASMLAVKTTSGSIFDQRFASSEIDSENSSPWSATDADPLATTSYALGNLRINIYETLGVVTSINVEGYFNSDYLGQTTENILILPKLGVKYIST